MRHGVLVWIIGLLLLQPAWGATTAFDTIGLPADTTGNGAASSYTNTNPGSPGDNSAAATVHSVAENVWAVTLSVVASTNAVVPLSSVGDFYINVWDTNPGPLDLHGSQHGNVYEEIKPVIGGLPSTSWSVDGGGNLSYLLEFDVSDLYLPTGPGGIPREYWFAVRAYHNGQNGSFKVLGSDFHPGTVDVLMPCRKPPQVR